MRLPHIALGDEVAANDALRKDLITAIRDKTLPPPYFEHPSVMSARGTDILVHPYCLYMDAVPFTKTGDSITGIFAYFMLSDSRHLLFTVRKQEMCTCGCRGLRSNPASRQVV